MDWISVNDRIPNEEEIVILCTVKGEVTMGWWHTHPERGARWFDITHGQWVEAEVEHWLELPKPPG